MPDPDTKFAFTSRRWHFAFVIIFFVAVWVSLGILCASWWPDYYFIGESKWSLNLSFLYFTPFCILFGIVIGFFFHRWLLARHAQPYSNEVLLTRIPLYGLFLRGLPGILFIAIIFGVHEIKPLQPLRYWWLAHKLQSSDKPTRDGAAKTISRDGHLAKPYIEEWLESGNEMLIKGACAALCNTPKDELIEYYFELDQLLVKERSPITDAVASVYADRFLVFDIEKSGRMKWKRLADNPAAKRNILLYVADTYNIPEEYIDRIAWDAEKRKYYLEPEPAK
jgi:hypothetical protein